MGYKRSVKEGVQKMLYANSGNVCAICGEKLVSDNTVNIAEICHIEAVNENGARYNSNLTNEYVNSYENLILLCPRCHKIIDDKANAERYTVKHLKRMKKIHEDKVRTALEKESVIDTQIRLEGYDVSSIVDEYNRFMDYSKEKDENFIYKALKDILSMKIEERLVAYNIAELCSSKEDELEKLNGMVDVNLIYHLNVNTEWYGYVKTLYILEMKKIIEVCGIGPDDGYEDEYGDWHMGEDNYSYKVAKGEWYLENRGKLLVIIRSLFGNEQDFYDFMINRNIELLKTIEKK